jgi:hypothetical protein
MKILKLAFLGSLRIAFFGVLKAALFAYILFLPDTTLASSASEGGSHIGDTASYAPPESNDHATSGKRDPMLSATRAS